MPKTKKEIKYDIEVRAIDKFMKFLFKEMDKGFKEREYKDDKEREYMKGIFKEMKMFIYTEAFAFALKDKVKVERVKRSA